MNAAELRGVSYVYSEHTPFCKVAVDNIDITFEVVCFVEVTLRIALGATQMHKPYTRAETTHHIGTIVATTYAKRTGAEAESVTLVRHSLH